MPDLQEELSRIRAMIDRQELAGQALSKQVSDMEHENNYRIRRRLLALNEQARRDKWCREMDEFQRTSQQGL